MSTNDNPSPNAPTDIYVPLADFDGWFVCHTYRFKGGKPRIRSCTFCRRRKITCSGPSLNAPDKKCVPCRNKNQTCVYALTETELDRFNNLKQTEGLAIACEKLGLKREVELTPEQVLDNVVQELARVPLNGLPEEKNGGLPSLLLCSTLVNYFLQPDVAPPIPNLTSELFEGTWPTDSLIIMATAYGCLSAYLPPRTPELAVMFPWLTTLTSQEIRGYLDALEPKILKIFETHPINWNYMISLGVYSNGFLHRGHGPAKLEALYRQSYHASMQIMDDLALHYQSGFTTMSNAEWLRTESLRRSMWLIQVGLLQLDLIFGRVSMTLPWKILRKLPLVCDEKEFQRAQLNGLPVDLTLSGWDLTEHEWKLRWTLEWLELPRGEERYRALKIHIGNMKQRNPWSLYMVCFLILIRSCRGRLNDCLWPTQTLISDLDDVGEMSEHSVGLEEFLSASHWEELLEDVFAEIPQEVLQADGDGRGDLLFEYSQRLWGKEFGMRLVVVLNLLHEAKMGTIVRSMPPRTPGREIERDKDVLVADLFVTGSDEDLVALLREALLISRNFGSLLKLNPTLQGIVLAPFPQLSRVGFLHLAIARRLQLIGDDAVMRLVKEALDDAKVTLRVLEILSVRAPWVNQQKETFQEILESGREPTLQDAGRMWGGLGYLRR